MSTNVFLFALSWVGILILLAGIGIAWILLRAGWDLVEWFREEILEDSRARKPRRRGR